MLGFLKKIDSIVLIVVITIIVGVVVISLRSKTYSIGYEIAHLKNKERTLRQKKEELQSQLATVQRDTRDRLLSEKDGSGNQRFILPDQNHVIKE